MLSFRAFSEGDEKELASILLELKHLYPGIETWIPKEIERIKRKESYCLLVISEGHIVGVSISALAVKPNKNNNVKLKTFYIAKEFEGFGLGPCLLDSTINYWANKRASRMYVTFAEEELDPLVGFFVKYGFLLDGVSPLLYREGSAEFVMGKIFLYGSMSEEDFPNLIKEYLFKRRGHTLNEFSETEFVCKRHDRIQEQLLTFVKIVTDIDPNEKQIFDDALKKKAENKCGNAIIVSFYPFKTCSEQVAVLDGYDIENFFYPLRIKRRKYAGVINAILPDYASQLLYDISQTKFLPDKRAFRTDKVYYKYPDAYKGISRGSSLVFYETEPTKAIIGEGQIEQVVLSTPETLYNEYERKGVLSLSEIKGYADGHNNVLALVLGKVTRYPRKIPLDAIRSKINPDFNPQGGSFINQDTLDKIRDLGNYFSEKV